MPLGRLANEAGVFRPEEVAMLGRVFDQLAEPGMDTQKREELASRILSFFMAGIKDERELTAVSKRVLTRR